MFRIITIAAIATAILWGCGGHGRAFGDWRNINGSTLIDGPLVVHGPLTIDGPAIIHGVVRARKISVNGPMIGSLPHNEHIGGSGREMSSATAIHGVLKVHGSLDVDGELTVNGPLICEKTEENPQLAAAAPQQEESHLLGFSELQHFLGLPLR